MPSQVRADTGTQDRTRPPFRALMGGPLSRRDFLTRAAVLGVSGTALAGVLAGCGAAQPTPTVGTPAAGGAAGTTVDIAGSAFSPQALTIAPGQAVTWTNHDRGPHTATSNEGSWDSGNIAPGAAFSRTFDQPGTFPYHCTIHPFMTGTVVVKS